MKHEPNCPAEHDALHADCSCGPKNLRTINLGTGRFIINHGYYGEQAALFIEQAPAPGKPGADASGSGLPPNRVVDGGTIITFENIACAEALAAELQSAIARIGSRRGSGHIDDDGSVFTRKYNE
ncbi:MAG: hypothetical protein WDM91_11195 [Rhizomicrobium sp.]